MPFLVYVEVSETSGGYGTCHIGVKDEEKLFGDPPSAPVAAPRSMDSRWWRGGGRSNGWLVDERFCRSSQLNCSLIVS